MDVPTAGDAPRRVSGSDAELLVVVHGGVDMHLDAASSRTMVAAADAGCSAPGDLLDAAAVAVSHLEADPAFNAGVGSVLNASGLAEVDAAIIDGSTGRFGAVGAAPDITAPATVALEVLRRRNGVLISGVGARDLAEQIGVDCRDLRTDEQITLFEEFLSGATSQSRFTGRGLRSASESMTGAISGSGRDSAPVMPTETVGSIVVCAGRVVAASSTGGVVGKVPGRIGDAAVLGAGIWADDRVGVLCSGMGEAMIELQLALRVAQRVHDGDALDDAVAWAVSHARHERNAICAVVAVDAHTEAVSAAHSGSAFPVRARSSQGAYWVDSTDVTAGEVGVRQIGGVVP